MMAITSKIRRYFWLKKIRRLTQKQKISEGLLLNLGDDHLYAVIRIAKRLKSIGKTDLIPLSLIVTINQSEIAGYLFCTSDADLKSTLCEIEKQILNRSQEMSYKSSAPYSSSSGSRLAGR